MKRIIKIFFMVLLFSVKLLLPKNTVNAETKSISNNSIKFLAYNYPWDLKTEWVEFKFVPQGNGTAKLKYYLNGKILSPKDINRNLTMYYNTDFKTGNIYGYEGITHFIRGQRMYNIAEILESLTFTYGVDHFQIIQSSYTVPPPPILPPMQDPSYGQRFIPDEGMNGALILGTIYSNLGNRNFNDDLRYSGTRGLYQFRVEEDGLYAQYKNQVKIPDGEYIIKTAENENIVIESGGVKVETNNYIGTNNQKFSFIYDNKHKAYKIKGNNGVLSLFNKNGSDVMSYQDSSTNDQFWYLEDVGNSKYRFINASSIFKRLNLDSNNKNISIAERRYNIKQEFKIVKYNENSSLTDGEWEIVSKLNNNKVLNLNIGGIDPSNVTIWDNANVTQQKWKFEYNSSKNAFRIKNSYNNGSLEWNASSNTNVHALGSGDVNEQYWLLEYVGDGYYIFKNYHNPNMVLDLYNSDTRNASNIQVFRRNNGDNQKFKLVR
ncbi:hemagglutinin component HA33 [Clostridium perfringens]|uniref:Hemagglutinin component HA33 n=1 Tax=Clostridium perfringens TaxID=1502 RepID=A0A2X3HY29_CLOPF|nr:RICIN domain-containing protein [Clostridium perfringens]SQC85148.1 hemagglutinin component HA33 [Clostridium perfringens]